MGGRGHLGHGVGVGLQPRALVSVSPCATPTPHILADLQPAARPACPGPGVPLEGQAQVERARQATRLLLAGSLGVCARLLRR